MYARLAFFVHVLPIHMTDYMMSVSTAKQPQTKEVKQQGSRRSSIDLVSEQSLPKRTELSKAKP